MNLASFVSRAPPSNPRRFDVCAWDELAKLAASSLQVGAQIRVEGFIQALAPPPPNPAKYRVRLGFEGSEESVGRLTGSKV